MSASALLVEPAFCTIPPYDWTLGPEVADLARLADYGPDPEQAMALDAIFGQARGRSAAFETGVAACRQNIKTGLFKQVGLGWLYVTGERLVVWSAHEWDTVKEAFRDLEELITGSDYLRREVRSIYRGNGDEAIELLSGSRMIFKTRTKGGGRGLSGSKVILDEAMFLQPVHMGSLLPTMSAQPDPQVLYGGSAGLAESAVWRGVRDRGRAGDPHLAWIEFCSPPPSQVCAAGDRCTHALDIAGCGCDDPVNWQRGNTSLGRTRPNGTGLTLEYIAAERRAMPPAEFGRERMGWWDDPAEGGKPISTAAWADRADPSSQVTDPVAMAFSVAPDGSVASVAVGGRRADGLGHGELVDRRPGTGWLMGRLLELAGRWNPCVLVMNGVGAAAAFEKELIERGFAVANSAGKDPPPGKRRLHVVGTREYAQACGALAADVANDRWRHLGQAPVDAAVAGARTRPLADAWAWNWTASEADISPLEAITLARHGHATHGTAAGAFFGSWR